MKHVCTYFSNQFLFLISLHRNKNFKKVHQNKLYNASLISFIVIMKYSYEHILFYIYYLSKTLIFKNFTTFIFLYDWSLFNSIFQ